MNKEKEPFDLECLYCGLKTYFRDTNWREGKRRCSACNDPNFKELKKTKDTIDTYGKEYEKSLEEFNKKRKEQSKSSDIDSNTELEKYWGTD